jgi:hypothetical protein
MSLSACLNEIRTSDAVAIIGAGASFLAGMPLAGQLAPLVWQTLDANPDVKSLTGDLLGLNARTAKEIVGNEDWDRLRLAFSKIAANPDAQMYFQQTFVRLDQQRSTVPSPVHTALAHLIHESRVSHVISLNWDTLLEVAFRSLYGIDVNAQGQKLWKPHGDCLRAEEPWILPHDPGFIPDELAARMAALASDRPRTLLIVGYSERDDTVVERLLRPLGSRWRVFRISPNAIGEGAVQLPAQEALEALVARLCPRPHLGGWEHVTFVNQRGVEGAVSGERLGPKDVDTCPRLPHFETAARNLDLLHAVEIAGGPGCGKSITAWQLARTYHREGWEVLRLDLARVRGVDDLPLAVQGTYWKKVLVVDDAQALREGFAERLANLAGPRTKVIRATTDSAGERSSAVRIPAKVAVEILAEDFRRRRAEVLPIVRRFDPRVGDGRSDTSLEDRIDEAAKSDTPWQFAFVLRGGWNQFDHELHVLRDFDRSDLLLVLVATRQIVSLDGGCTVEDLLKDAHHMHRTEQWARDGVERLRRRNAILPGDRLRCPHIRSAATVVQSFFRNRKNEEFSAIVSFLRSSPLLYSCPLRGISWLLSEVFSTGRYFGPKETTWAFLWPEHVGRLVQKCARAVTSIERRDAAFLLGTLLGHRVFSADELLMHAGTLKLWLEAADGANAYAFGNVINNLYNENREAARRLVQSVAPETVARLLTTARTTEGYVWGYFLGRLLVAAEDNWRARLAATLPRDRIRVLAAEFKSTQLDDLTEFLKYLAYCDFDFATECLTLAVPAIQTGFATEPLAALAATHELRWVLLGHPLFEPHKPTRAQLKLSKTITSAIRAERVAVGIETCRYGDWEQHAELLGWVRHVNPARHREIVERLDWQGFDRRTVGMWTRPPRELRLLLHSLILDRAGRPVRAWVAERAERIHQIDPILATASPEAAVAVVRRGGRLDLGGHNGSDWGLQSEALTRVGAIDQGVVAAAVAADLPRITDHLAGLEGIDCEEFPFFLETLHRLTPDLLSRMLDGVDLKVASERWPKTLEHPRREVRRGGRAVFRFVQRHGSGALKSFAKRLASAKSKKPPTNK